MKKKNIYIGIILLLLALSGCENSEKTSEKTREKTGSDVSLLEDSVEVNQKLYTDSESNVEVTFAIDVVTQNEDAKIELVKVNGSNDIEVSWGGETIIEDFAKGYSYKGYTVESQFVDLEFIKPRAGQVYKIDSLVFDVDGKEVEFVPKTPIQYEFYDEEVEDGKYNDSLLKFNMMMNTTTSSEEIRYSINSLGTIEIKDVFLSGNVNVVNLSMVKNEKNEYTEFPVSLNADDNISLLFDCEYEDDTEFPINLFTTTIVQYTTKKGDIRQGCYPLTIIAVSDTDDIDKIINHYLE